MDPVTTAIAAALANLGTTAVADAYSGLKALLVRKFGEESGLTDAVAKLEAKPDSEARKAVLAEEVAAARVGENEEIIRAADVLAAAVAHLGPSVTVHQTVEGNQNVFSGTGTVFLKHGP